MPHCRTHTVDEALKLNIEDKEESSPRRPSTKRARPAEEHPAGAHPAESAAEGGASRPKRRAAPAPATETPVRSRGKKVKTDTAAPAAGAPTSKAKKATEKKVGSGDDEAAKEQQEADEVDALADEPAENGATALTQGTLLSSPTLPFFIPVRISLCADVDARLQKLLMRLGQTKRQAVSSLKVPKLKPSPFRPPRRPNAPFILGPVPESQESVFHRLFLFICSCKTLILVLFCVCLLSLRVQCRFAP